jgi:L-ascorbate metabolism protein UlaG (beta-lactamase superfamily)
MSTQQLNPALSFIRSDWDGNPTDANGRFLNHEFPFTTGFKDVWKWQTGPKPYREAKKRDTWKPALHQDATVLHSQGDCLVWLGHAWFFMRIDGINILLDPVLYKIPLVKQIVENPFQAHAFPPIDLLLLSHDHRDHMDKRSITELAKLNPEMQIVTGLKMTTLLRKWCRNPIVEMGWYQQFHLPGTSLKLTYLPTRHWSRRYLNDTNTRLWGAFMLQNNTRTIYFGSDSGYGSHFKELNTLFPNIDIAMLGIGAFRPEWFMHQAHMSPWDAAKAFNDSGATTFLPMHYGTLDLSDEASGEPISVIRQLEADKQISGNVLVPNIGELIYL